MMQATFGDGAQVMDGLTSLFHAAHRPIRCLKQSGAVPDAALHAASELMKRPASDAASYLKRTVPLILGVTAPSLRYAR